MYASVQVLVTGSSVQYLLALSSGSHTVTVFMPPWVHVLLLTVEVGMTSHVMVSVSYHVRVLVAAAHQELIVVVVWSATHSLV